MLLGLQLPQSMSSRATVLLMRHVFVTLTLAYAAHGKTPLGDSINLMHGDLTKIDNVSSAEACADLCCRGIRPPTEGETAEGAMANWSIAWSWTKAVAAPAYGSGAEILGVDTPRHSCRCKSLRSTLVINNDSWISDRCDMGHGSSRLHEGVANFSVYYIFALLLGLFLAAGGLLLHV